MRIDHIGYAVKDIYEAINSFELLGYSFGEIIKDEDRNIYLAFGVMGHYKIELVAPLHDEKESPIDRILLKLGPTPYHFCYISDDFEEDIRKMNQNSFKIVVPPKRSVAFNGKKVVFMYSLSAGLVELVEE